MSRPPPPFTAPDLSAFAKALRGQLAAAGAIPSHLELLTMQARAAGLRNVQHLRAEAIAAAALATALTAPPPTEPPADLQRVRRATRHFDRCGRLIRWPGRAGERHLCLWGLWSRLPPGELGPEARVNGDLAQWHTFGARALLRRDWFDAGRVDRTSDGRAYRRIARRPPPDARALIGHVRTLRGGSPVAAVTSAPAPTAPAP